MRLSVLKPGPKDCLLLLNALKEAVKEKEKTTEDDWKRLYIMVAGEHGADFYTDTSPRGMF